MSPDEERVSLEVERIKNLKRFIAGEITTSLNPSGTMKKWREIFEINQSELAKYLEVGPSTISDYESGRRESPGIKVVARFVDALVDIDSDRGGQIIRKQLKDFPIHEEIFKAREFFEAVKAEDFIDLIEGIVVANEARLEGLELYGYTIIDSLKTILEVPVERYMELYGKTPVRALIFKDVQTGRSPMIAIRVSRFSSQMKPSMIVFHGPREVDKVAIKIAEVEKIPLVITQKPIYGIEKALEKYV